jgi:signal transduction histidine kinase
LSRPQQLLELACLVSQARNAGLGLLSIQGELLEHLTHGQPKPAEESGGVLEIPEAYQAGVEPGVIALLQFVLRQPGPVRLKRWVDANLDQPAPPGLSAQGPFLGVPLNCPGRCRGVLYLVRSPGDAEFSADDVAAVSAIGALLEHGSLFEEARLLARLRLLNQVAQAAAGNLELAPILRAALRELDRQLPLQVCAVWLVEETEDRGQGSEDRGQGPSSLSPVSNSPSAMLVLADSTAPSGAGQGLAPGLRVALDLTPFAPCLTSGQAYYADLASPDRRPIGAGSGDPAPTGDRSSLHPVFGTLYVGATCCFAVPLRAGERTVGILQSVCQRPAGFSGDQIQLLYLVADLLGPAISNCQLFSRLSSAYEALRQAQGQLIQAEKMRALGELAGGMAHEFNNSLCGVLGFLELALLKTDLPPAVRGDLEAARTCSVDAAHVVRRVQDFARWKAEGPAHEPLDLNDLVRNTVELIRHKWESLENARGARVAVEVKTEAALRVAGCATELREVLTNLAFNAVDAMPRGGTLTLHVWSTITEVFLAVRDTGVGIPESVRHRLFEPFFTTKGERGNGLGLSVTFGIVKRHGGEIEVESQSGRGTTFLVRLPAVSDRPAAAKETSATVAGPRRCLRILVVEDEESIRRFLHAGLSGLGHKPKVTANAREALAAFAEEPFDVVLTDLGLPEISGEQVAYEVRKRSPATPVVLLTGWADQLQAERTSLECVSRILGKPVTLATLAATLTAVCPP